MIIVKNIELVEVDRDVWRVIKYDSMPVSAYPIEDVTKYQGVEEEMIYGKEFIRPDGKRICIGATKEVQESIGIVFEAFDNMSNTISEQQFQIGSLMEQNSELRKKIRGSTFWQRLKYLFTTKL